MIDPSPLKKTCWDIILMVKGKEDKMTSISFQDFLNSLSGLKSCNWYETLLTPLLSNRKHFKCFHLLSKDEKNMFSKGKPYLHFIPH